ncbi:MAG: Hsp20/alpha crystallin family protein [Actinomycetota bacterium]|nr:Hsp20/alpha crystallin family protein [Actinomycetota bacterium]
MSRSRVNPFRGFLDVVSEMDRMRHLGRTGRDRGAEDLAGTSAIAWVPVADIYAVGDELVIRVELSGVDPADVELELAERVLTISGERHTETDQAATYYTRERHYGPFRRSMVLPDDVDEDRISATFVNGLAEIRVQGAASSSATNRRRIPFQKQPGTGDDLRGPDTQG